MDGDLDDAELISRVRRGDHDAYTALYRRHVDAARRLARACCRSVQDADDVTAEVFAAVLAAIVHGKGPTDSFRPYLLRSIRNECAHVSRPRAGAVLPVDLLAEQSGDESAAVSATELPASPGRPALQDRRAAAPAASPSSDAGPAHSRTPRRARTRPREIRPPGHVDSTGRGAADPASRTTLWGAGADGRNAGRRRGGAGTLSS